MENARLAAALAYIQGKVRTSMVTSMPTVQVKWSTEKKSETRGNDTEHIFRGKMLKAPWDTQSNM